MCEIRVTYRPIEGRKFLFVFNRFIDEHALKVSGSAECSTRRDSCTITSYTSILFFWVPLQLRQVNTFRLLDGVFGTVALGLFELLQVRRNTLQVQQLCKYSYATFPSSTVEACAFRFSRVIVLYSVHWGGVFENPL